MQYNTTKFYQSQCMVHTLKHNFSNILSIAIFKICGCVRLLIFHVTFKESLYPWILLSLKWKIFPIILYLFFIYFLSQPQSAEREKTLARHAQFLIIRFNHIQKQIRKVADSFLTKLVEKWELGSHHHFTTLLTHINVRCLIWMLSLLFCF